MPAIDFNAEEVEPNKGFDLLPPGDYQAVISESEEKATKDGKGSYLQLTFVVTAGEFANRKVWSRLNLNNPNEQAVAIAKGDLSAICHAVNVLRMSDTTEIHDLPIAIRVVQKLNKQSGEMQNEIKKYFSMKDFKQAKEAVKPTPKPASTPSTNSSAKTTTTAPWKKS